MSTIPVRTVVLGCGTVGAAVLGALRRPDGPLHRQLDVVGVAVRDLDRARPPHVDPALLTTDAVALAQRPDVELVVEAMGGTEPASDALAAALRRGADVVTANKAVVARDGVRLERLAAASGAVLRYEASAAAALPIVALLTAAAAGDRVERVEGVLSGTANHVLGLMEQGVALGDAVADAQAAGYAEADPARDLDGRDVADKLVLLARLAFGGAVTTDDVDRTGIDGLTAASVQAAAARGTRTTLVAVATRDGRLEVAPRELPVDDPLAAAEGPGNVVRVVLEHGGELVLQGAGAGGGATASAVLRDVGAVLAARGRTPAAAA